MKINRKGITNVVLWVAFVLSVFVIITYLFDGTYHTVKFFSAVGICITSMVGFYIINK